MLSKNTHNLFSSLLRVSHTIKPVYSLPLSHSLSTLPSAHRIANLHNPSRFSFSSKNESDSNNLKSTETDGFDKDLNTAGAKKDKLKAIGRREKSRTTPPVPLEKLSDKRIQSVPIRPTKLTREGEEDDKNLETYVLFNSSTPIIPHSHQNGMIKTGYLGTSHISNKLAFFLQNPLGEIYTVGIILEDNVNSSLKKTITGHTTPGMFENATKYKTEISIKPKNYKVKLNEIEFRDNCIFAKAVPYPDSKMTEAEKRVDVPAVLAELKDITTFLRISFALEKIEAFKNISFDMPKEKKLDTWALDKILCTLLGECLKLSSYTKENLHVFVQAFLEERSIISRLFMIKKKVEEVKNIMEVVNQSVMHTEEGIWKANDNAKARLSFEYIRSNYFGGENGTQKGPANQPGGNPNISGPAKKFMDKLCLIKDDVSRDKVRKEIERFSLQDKSSSEYHKLYTYLDDVFSIPWDNFSEEHWDIEYSQKVLEKQLFGLEKVKERIIEMIAVNKLKRVGNKENNSNSQPEKKKGFVILLNGPPGVGKTTIAKAIATALKRESRFISFAGVTDPAFVKGHKRTYLDAQPGVFVKELTKAKVMNPVFILDEVDKLGKHQQGVDPYYSLMEILNPEENQNFGDHYLDIKVDFSNVIFILTSNNALNMLEPLRNRLEVIEVPAYIEQDKLRIARNYLLPGVLAENGLNSQSIVYDDETLVKIIKGWCYYESGVRELRRCLEKISRKHVLEILDDHSSESSHQKSIESTTNQQHTGHSSISQPTEQLLLAQNIDFQGLNAKATTSEPVQQSTADNNTKPVSVVSNPVSISEVEHLKELRSQHKLVFKASKDPNDEALKKYLGLPVFDDMYGRKDKKLRTGTANVLTVSGFVGHVLSVECVFDATNPNRKGQFTCSGNLQKVLQESLTIARLVALRFLPEEKIKEISEKNIHIHFLQGSSPKDGPSAGISICSALISIALNKPIAPGISMTGELSLNGEVYKIGGVQAKVTASKALDIKRIILPWGNRADFFELPQMLKEGLEVYFVKEYREVYNILFGDSPKHLEGIEKYTDGKLAPAIKGPEDVRVSYPSTE